MRPRCTIFLIPACRRTARNPCVFFVFCPFAAANNNLMTTKRSGTPPAPRETGKQVADRQHRKRHHQAVRFCMQERE